MRLSLTSVRALLFLTLLCVSANALAGDISGTITDAASGGPFPFAEIELREIGLSVHTDADGFYLFNNIPAGRYTVTITHGPYDDYEIGVVDVTSDGAAKLSSALQSDIAPMDKPAESDPDVTMPPESDGLSLRNTPIRLQDLPIRGYADWIALQPGTVRRSYGAPVHVRGGRIEEFSYYVDGFSQQDPFTGDSYTSINGNSIADIQLHTGYRGPADGWTSSGVADVTTIESWKHTGSLEVITDNFHGERSDYGLYAADLAGPLSGNNGQLTYALAGELKTIGNRELGGPGDWNYDGAWHGKFRWQPADGTRALFGTRGSYNDWKHTPLAYYFNSVHSPRGIDENYSIFGSIERNLSSRTILDASLNWFSTRHRQGDGVYFNDIWAYGRPNGNPGLDLTDLYWDWDDMFLDPDSLLVGRHIIVHTPVVESTFTVPLSDGDSVTRSFIVGGDEGHVWEDYFEQKGSYIGGRIDLTHAHGRASKGMLALEFQRHTVRAYQNLIPILIQQGIEGGFQNINRYGYDELANETDEGGVDGVKHPLFLAAYLNERIVKGPFSLDIGVRWDHLDYDTYAPANATQPLDQNDRVVVDKVDAFNRISPRLSATILAGNENTFHISAGRYIQRPSFQDIYTGFGFFEFLLRTHAYDFRFPSGSLEPVSVTSSSAGWYGKITEDVSLGVTGYFKDYEERFLTFLQSTNQNSYAVLRNEGIGTSKGLEITGTMQRVSGIAGWASYSLASTKGTLDLCCPQNIVWQNQTAPLVVTPEPYDQRQRFITALDLRSGPDQGPLIAGWTPLANMGVSAVFEMGSGFPYTPVGVYNEVGLYNQLADPVGPIASKRSPATYRLDLKINKAFPISGSDLELYLWVINVFDRRNVVDVYGGTGEPDNTGWLETEEGRNFIQRFNQIHDASLLAGEQKYRFRENDPSNFDIPRQIRFGMRVSL